MGSSIELFSTVTTLSKTRIGVYCLSTSILLNCNIKKKSCLILRAGHILFAFVDRKKN